MKTNPSLAWTECFPEPSGAIIQFSLIISDFYNKICTLLPIPPSLLPCLQPIFTGAALFSSL